MDEDIDVIVEQLRAAGTDPSTQLPALLKLAEWYLNKAKTTLNGADFTKANALYNAALVRSRLVNHETDDDQILRRLIETYREFLYAFAHEDEEIRVDEIRHEINSHKEFVTNERRIFKERVDEIESCFNTNEKTEDQYKFHADKMQEVFRDIQDMYVRLVSMFVKESEISLGKPPCDYAIIALGSIARMEATPFSDLEFAILYLDPSIGNKISYFRTLSHFLHLKVLNLGETILPTVGIEQLNNFQSSDPKDDWFYDSETPRGISFDGAMPWASKTPLGRMTTKNKPALELIKTPEEMAELQNETIAVKEGYHLADLMSTASLLYGDQALLDEYNERVYEKLNTESPAFTVPLLAPSKRIMAKLQDEEIDVKEAGIIITGALLSHDDEKQVLMVKYNEHVAKKLNLKSRVTKGKCTKTVGLIRGIRQMIVDVEEYSPFHSYLGEHCVEGGLFDAKKQFYRLISLLLSGLRLIFDIRSPSPWQVISELQTRGIIGETESAKIKVCLSIANEIRLKTYFANNGQRELFSPVPQHANTTELSVDDHIFHDFGEDVLVRLLSTSNDIFTRCRELCIKYLHQEEIDISIFQNLPVPSSKATLLGYLYIRLQNFPKALEWMKSAPKGSPDYAHSLSGQAFIYFRNHEYEKSIELNESALEVHYQDEETSNLNVVSCINNIASALQYMGQNEKARARLEEALNKHDEIYGEGSQTTQLSQLMRNLGALYRRSGDEKSALETFQAVEQMNSLMVVPDKDLIYLNLDIAFSLSALGQRAQSLEYVKRALLLSKKVFGEYDLSPVLARIYMGAGSVYESCKLDDEALSLFKRSLLVYGNSPSPGKLDCLLKLGSFFSERCQMEKAVEHLEIALEQARTLYHGKPNFILVKILNNLGAALKPVEKFPWEKSLCCLREAKQMIDEMLGTEPAQLLASKILDGIGIIYQERGDLAKSLQCLKDSLSIKSILYGENNVNDSMAIVFQNIAYVAEKMGNVSEATEYYTKAIQIYRKIPLAKNKCGGFVTSLFRLGNIFEALGQSDEALKYLKELTEIAKVSGFKDWKVVVALKYLSKKYHEMGCICKEKFCLQEAREMIQSLREDDSLPLQVLIKLESSLN